jgi:hypothetical protein
LVAHALLSLLFGCAHRCVRISGIRSFCVRRNRFPGEFAVIDGGVHASQADLLQAAVLVDASQEAVIGDSVG